ncbi:DUF4235 domain-containing protein [Streptomyces fulvoviolaceus]|uniref:DUF4235 domain-containing protein n=1 Tax=Streptomyces fulvoviolaceus TaxID=285535 RepID=UPI0004C5A8F6|nr:DUF4235 domain-containing protein [Streptomyces fulvoviolaceus]
MSKKRNKKKLKLPLAYKPLGFVLGWSSGALAGLAFRKTWMAIRHEEDAPDALDRDRGWGEILLAAAVQGALFAVVRSAVDRTGAKVVERQTGVWPADDTGGQD